MKATGSPFCKDLVRVKDDFFSRGSFSVGDGFSTRFWEDTWLGNRPLSLQYPALYNIVQWKHVYVAAVLAEVPLNIAFRRALTGDKWTAWIHLVHRLMQAKLSQDQMSSRACCMFRVSFPSNPCTLIWLIWGTLSVENIFGNSKSR